MTVDPVKVVGPPLEAFYSIANGRARIIMGYSACINPEYVRLADWSYDRSSDLTVGFRLCRTRSVNP
jgi:ABC-type taurine transport system substrate-binding protein